MQMWDTWCPSSVLGGFFELNLLFFISARENKASGVQNKQGIEQATEKHIPPPPPFFSDTPREVEWKSSLKYEFSWHTEHSWN